MSTRVLYISGSIGLGHAGRDLAIASALRRHRPDVEIKWLAGDPARRLLEEAGETVLPESDGFVESGVAEGNAEEFSLNIVNYVQRAGTAWKRAVAAFAQVNARYDYDLLIGDEAYEVGMAMVKRPELRKAPFVMIYDFLGLDAMSWNPIERLAVWSINRRWGGGFKAAPPREDLVLFVGEPTDVDDRPLGLALANRRRYAERHYNFLGYVLPFDVADYADRSHVRKALGYDDRPLLVCSVGGTAVGVDLLRLCAASYAPLRERIPDARMVLVCGPRIDPTEVEAPDGVEIHGFVPRLYEHFAAADVAIVQGGSTTTLELTALRTPFLYFPLANHFEQNLVVAERVARHRAGRHMRYTETTPESLAQAIAGQIGRPVDWPPISSNGAARAAKLIDSLMHSPAAREQELKAAAA